MLVLIGTCMVIGDGILTPAISGNQFICLCYPTTMVKVMLVDLYLTRSVKDIYITANSSAIRL